MNFPGSGFFSALISSPRRRWHSDLDTGTLDEEMGGCGWYIYIRRGAEWLQRPPAELFTKGEGETDEAGPHVCVPSAQGQGGVGLPKERTTGWAVVCYTGVWGGDWAGAKPVRQAFILFLLFLQFSIFLLSYFYFQIFNSNSSKLHHKCKHNFIIIYLLFLSFMQILLNMHPKIFILGK